MIILARYAISPEGAIALRSLSKQLYTEANSILEASSVLDSVVSSLSEGLGIYSDEITAITSKNRNILKKNREDILALGEKVLQKADDVELLVAMTTSTKMGISGNGVTFTSYSCPDRYPSKIPQYSSIEDIPQEEFECISNYNADASAFNSPVREGKSTKETRLLSQMINDRIISESKTLYRRATLLDLNGLNVNPESIDSLIGQQFQFSGFMSTTPDPKHANYVSHGDVFFELFAPEGVNALDLSSLMYNEVLFDSPHCQIIGVERRGNDIHIIASIL